MQMEGSTKNKIKPMAPKMSTLISLKVGSIPNLRGLKRKRGEKMGKASRFSHRASQELFIGWGTEPRLESLRVQVKKI